jgi:PKD repeat protein
MKYNVEKMNAKPILLVILILFACILNISQVKSQFSLDVTVDTDKPSYTKREIVNVTGDVKYEGNLVQDGLIGIQVEDSLFSTIAMRTLPLNTNQSLPFSFEITSLLPTDEVGTYTPKTERNKNMWFSMTVKNKGLSAKQVYVSITIMDSALIPLETDLGSLSIPAGETGMFMPRMPIPNWATVGTAHIFGNVYDNWPKLLGRPLCPEKLSHFTIIESVYYDPPNSTLPSHPTQKGTYETSFRLPPNMQIGSWKVSASAWSSWAGGFKGFQSANFQTIYVPSAPWASFVIKPPMASPNYAVTFDGSSSSPEAYNDTITSYYWDFGDGKNKTSTSSTTTHSYINVGNYTVTLKVTDLEGLWNTTSKEAVIMVIRDVSVINIESLETVYDDWNVSVSVTVKNEGSYDETFNVELYAHSTLIGTKQVSSLGPLATKTVTFNWDTTGLTLLANYTLQAVAETLVNETDTADNSLDFGPIFVVMNGDIIFNREIDLYDAVKLLTIYGTKENSPNWNIMVDLVRDGEINLYDAVKLLSKYGTSY